MYTIIYSTLYTYCIIINIRKGVGDRDDIRISNCVQRRTCIYIYIYKCYKVRKKNCLIHVKRFLFFNFLRDCIYRAPYINSLFHTHHYIIFTVKGNIKYIHIYTVFIFALNRQLNNKSFLRYMRYVRLDHIHFFLSIPNVLLNAYTFIHVTI